MFQKSKTSLIGIVILATGLVMSSCNKRLQYISVGGCPAVGVLAHTGSLTRFNSTEQTNENVILDATIADLDFTCLESNTIDTTISFSIQARRGPAMTNDVHSFTYMIVVIKDNYMITTKKKFTTQIRFAPGQDTAGVRETIVQHFDNNEVSLRYDYEIFVGFELTPDELKFNVTR